MKRIVIALLALVATAAAGYTATDMWPIWKSKFPSVIISLEKGIADVKHYRDAQCPKQGTRDLQSTCNAAYDLIMARARVDQLELKLYLAASNLPQAQRDKIVSLVNLDEHNARNKATEELQTQIDLMFPAARQSSMFPIGR